MRSLLGQTNISCDPGVFKLEPKATGNPVTALGTEGAASALAQHVSGERLGARAGDPGMPVKGGAGEALRLRGS